MTIDNNFAFDGQHCLTDYGLIYVPSATRPTIAPRSVVSYTIDGMSGTQAYGDQHIAQTYTETGVLYYTGDLRSETEARALWRRIAAWLCAGRRQLIWDSEPDRYVIAEVSQLRDGKFAWVESGLQVTWLCQPYHWDRQLQSTSVQLTSDTPSAAVTLHVETSQPAPMTITAAVDGSASLTALEISMSDKRVSLTGMAIAPGESLQVQMEYPIGATVTTADGSTQSAMACMEQLDVLAVPAGGAEVSVTASFDGDGGAVTVALAARGCWE